MLYIKVYILIPHDDSFTTRHRALLATLSALDSGNALISMPRLPFSLWYRIVRTNAMHQTPPPLSFWSKSSLGLMKPSSSCVNQAAWSSDEPPNS